MSFDGRIAVVLAGIAFAAIPAAAQEVGTATAVNPLSESTRPGATTTTLNVGSRIVHNERIHTTPTGSVQLLFTDHSTMSISANADIVINEYVYNPESGSGHMLATIAAGALRYVGGKLSHQGQAIIETPVAAIGIRGAVATIMQVKNVWQVTDNFGALTITNGAGTTKLLRPGFSVIIASQNTAPSQPIQVTAALTSHQIQIMSSQRGQNGGVSGLKSVNVGGCGIGQLHGSVCPQTPWINTDSGEFDASQLLIQSQTGRNTFKPPPPTYAP